MQILQSHWFETKVKQAWHSGSSDWRQTPHLLDLINCHTGLLSISISSAHYMTLSSVHTCFHLPSIGGLTPFPEMISVFCHACYWLSVGNPKSSAGGEQNSNWWLSFTKSLSIFNFLILFHAKVSFFSLLPFVVFVGCAGSSEQASSLLGNGNSFPSYLPVTV